MTIDDERAQIRAVQQACDTQAWLYAESGMSEGIVPVHYQPALGDNSERIFARIVRLWSDIDRPNAMIMLPDSPAGVGAFRRCRHTSINVALA